MITTTSINLSGTGDTNGNGTYNSGTSSPKINAIKGGTYSFLASGTFSSGTTLTLQHKVGDAFVTIGQYLQQQEDVLLQLPKQRFN